MYDDIVVAQLLHFLNDVWETAGVKIKHRWCVCVYFFTCTPHVEEEIRPMMMSCANAISWVPIT